MNSILNKHTLQLGQKRGSLALDTSGVRGHCFYLALLQLYFSPKATDSQKPFRTHSRIPGVLRFPIHTAPKLLLGSTSLRKDLAISIYAAGLRSGQSGLLGGQTDVQAALSTHMHQVPRWVQWSQLSRAFSCFWKGIRRNLVGDQRQLQKRHSTKAEQSQLWHEVDKWGATRHSEQSYKRGSGVGVGAHRSKLKKAAAIQAVSEQVCASGTHSHSQLRFTGARLRTEAGRVSKKWVLTLVAMPGRRQGSNRGSAQYEGPTVS